MPIRIRSTSLLVTGLIAAGLDGIRRNLDPGDPFHGDIGQMNADAIAATRIGYLPRTLDVALDALERDEVIGKALGASALRHFPGVRRHESAQYQLQVHAWERETYFPIV